MGFMGYRRPDGSCGVRNHIAVVSAVVCANHVVDAIACATPGAKAVTHTEGCGRGPADVQISMRTLTGLGRNPNVAAVLLVGLGCEVIKPEFLAAGIAATGKPVEMISIQPEGGSRRTIEKGVEIARKLAAHAASLAREECPWAQFRLGLKCGGSDALSGITANPMVGAAVDWLVAQGGSAILAETTELIGAEDNLARRAADPQTAARLLELVRGQHRRAKDVLGPMADLVISPGNMDGGLSSIQEKSLGSAAKGGSSPVQQVVEYGEAPTRAGLVVMDTPGSDVFAMTGIAAGGAQAIVFTTGRGTPAGFPLAPVVKIASNSELFARMNDDMDLNAGEIVEGLSIEAAAERLCAFLERVAGGELTKAERNGADLLAIHTVGPSF
jgi:altronate dehydratase large subunit